MADITSIGTLLQIGDGGGPEAFTTIGQITDINLDGGEVALDETTTLADVYRTFLATNIDEGRLTADVVIDPGDTQYEQVITDRSARALRNFKLVFSDTSEYAFAAYIISAPTAIANGASVRGSITLKIVGQITRTTA